MILYPLPPVEFLADATRRRKHGNTAYGIYMYYYTYGIYILYV